MLRLLMLLSSDALVLLFGDECVNEEECVSGVCLSERVLQAPQRWLTTF